MRRGEVLEPKQAAIEAGVFAQQIYGAIRSGLLTVERKQGRVYILRESFKRWRNNLETRRRLRDEDRQAVAEARTEARI